MFSRGQTVYYQAFEYTYIRNEPVKKELSGDPYEIGVFVRYDARGNVVVQEACGSSRDARALAVDKRIGLPVEVTFPAENCVDT